MSRLQGKRVLITGGTSGIGLATVNLFLEQGAFVAFTGRRQEEGDKIQEKENSKNNCPRRCLFIKCDHTVPKECEESVNQTIASFGGIDILFNNAGVVFLADSVATSEEDWAYCISLNLTATWRMSKLVLPIMREQKYGVILNNSSDWGLVGGINAAAYCASKGGVINLTKAMALETAKENIRINALCPGDTFVPRWVERDSTEVLLPGETIESVGQEEIIRRLNESDSIPMGRVGNVEELAKSALFLCCEESSFCTGTTLVVDGGNTCQ